MNKFKSGKSFAILDFKFDYSNNADFVLPNWPYFPNGASPYDFNAIKFGNIKDGFNKVVGSQWARPISRLDMTAQGAMQMEGTPIWSDMTVDSRRDEAGWLTNEGDTATFGRISSFKAEYHDNDVSEMRNTPVLVAGNITHIKFGIILLPMEQVRRMSPEMARDCFGGNVVHGVTLHLADVKIPFPFYVEKVKWEDFTCFDNVNIEFKFQASTDYAIAYIALSDSKSGKTYIQVPQMNNSALMDGHSGSYGGSSPYGILARLLESAANRNLIAFGSLVTSSGGEYNLETARNRSMLIAEFHGETALPGAVFEQVDNKNIPVPAGLEELPMLPDKGFTYICDFQGIVYVTDQNRRKVMMPYMIFDLIHLHKVYQIEYAKIEKSGKEPNEATLEYGRQIRLIEALFKHQANVLQGVGYAYEALMYQGGEQ